ncbi:hypothetical protein IBX65_08175 [Candidatus Aerophobetes bacterium]|nr:hypothetical protein [Candidatus Aerophobetes bacterium]
MRKVGYYLIFSLFFLLAFILQTSYEISSSSISVSSLTSPQFTTITIYQTQDISLIQEKYLINFKKGASYVQFDLPKMVDTSSVHLSLLKHPDKVRVEEVTFSPSSNRALWRIHASQSIEEQLEITYFTGGILWEINYDMEIDEDGEKIASFYGWVTVENKSDKDFTRAKIRLITGEPHLLKEEKRQVLREVERIQALKMEADVQPPQIRKEAVSEYYLYQIEGERELKGKETTCFELFRSQNLSYELIYHFDFDRWGIFPQVIYKFENNQSFPLPAGPLKGWLAPSGIRTQYLGQSKIEYTSPGEKMEVAIAEETGLKLEKKITFFLRDGLEFGFRKDLVKYHEEEEYTIRINNFLEKEVNVTIRENVPGEWEYISSSIRVQRKEAHALEFELAVPAQEEKHFTYRIQKIFRLK